MKFKFLILGVLFSAIISAFLLSCDKSQEEVDANSFSDYELIGLEHNKGLDFVFEYVKQESQKQKADLKSATDFMVLVENGTQEFIKTSQVFQNETNKEIALNESKKPFHFYSSYSSNNLKSSTLENLYPSDVEDLLSLKQKEILNELNEILSNPALSIEEIISSLNNLDEKIKSECSDEEMDILLSATSIGRHSFQYWHDNLDKWISEFGSSYNLKSTKSFSWGEVGKNDVAYGVGGGVAGAVVGGSVSLGVLTLPGWAAGAIGGAIGGSVGNAILQIW